MTSFKQFVHRLQQAEIVPCPEGEEWKDMIDRISVSGTIADIDAETFFYFLEVLPPKFQSGSFFAFAEGAEPLRLFWYRVGYARRRQYFCRQLTWDETKQFCSLAFISLPH